MGETRKGSRNGGAGVAAAPSGAAIRAKAWAVVSATAVAPAPPAPTPPKAPSPPPGSPLAGTPAERPPSLTSDAPTPPRPPVVQPPQPPRPPMPPQVGTAGSSTAGVTATVAPLGPKGLRARLRDIEPRKLAIAGAVAAAVVAAAAVLGVVLLGGGGDDKPAQYAFDSDAVHRVTGGFTAPVSPGDSTSGDPDTLSGYGVPPILPGTPGSGTSKYSPPYRSGSSGRFIPYTPPNSTSGQSGSGGSGDGGGSNGAGSVPQSMPAGAYSYGGSGTIPAALWSPAGGVPASVGAAVTTSDGGCYTLSLMTGKNTASSTYCAADGALTAGPRSRATPTGQFAMTCPGAFIPAGNTALVCTAASGALREQMTGGVTVADTGAAWVATTSVSAPSGDSWTEQVTIDKASGNVVSLRSDINIAVFAYVESSTFALR